VSRSGPVRAAAAGSARAVCCGCGLSLVVLKTPLFPAIDGEQRNFQTTNYEEFGCVTCLYRTIFQIRRIPAQLVVSWTVNGSA
jgi:hypothetical protein